MPKFQTKYGYFSADGNEYIITTYKTPKPWINVISNGDYGLVISQAGGGFSWLNHSEFNRLNRWHQDLIQDNWGKYFYIKDNESNQVWSPTWMPSKTPLDFYKVTYGFGYAQFESVFNNIKIVLTVFIPLNEQIEIWNFHISNQNSFPVNLSLYSYFEWCLGSSADHHREFHKTFLETDFHPDLNCMTATKRLWEIPVNHRGHWNIQYPYLGFIHCTNYVEDYNGDKESFIGKQGSIEKPEGIFYELPKKKSGKWHDSIGTLRTNIKLKASDSKGLSFIIGLKKNKNQIRKTIQEYQDPTSVHLKIENVKKFWSERLNSFSVEIPDEAMNLLVNKWLKYQAISGRLWARTAYYQQSGAYGFRDQLQDSMVFLPFEPSFTKKQIRLHSRHQFKDGTVLHWWHPITETGLQTKITDDLLWLPFIILQYLDETGDYNILKIEEPYYDDQIHNDSLFNHCIKAIEVVLNRFSKRGLPLIGAGDWNDGLNAVGLDMKGESVWLAEFFYLILIRFSGLCNKIGKKKLAAKYLDYAKKLKVSFEKHTWDGNWFIRATKDNGEKVGSKRNKEGKIYLNTQTWAVISGITNGKLAEKALASVEKILLKKNGPLLLYPAYTKPDEMIGYLSRYAPGRRENGGVYTHAATWLIWAFCLLKKNDIAFETFKRICPVYNGLNPDEYLAEPYVTPGNIDGPDSPDYGMGGWTWYTGSATWLQKVIVDWIIGVRATPEGLLIDPCIPKEWNRFMVTRIFRGTKYQIKIFNEDNVSTGIKYLVINGKETNCNLLNMKSKNKVDVNVYMG